MYLETQIRQKGIELGFDRVGITTAAPLESVYAVYHQHWLSAGCAARMGYLHRNNDKRFSPDRLLDGAKSVICVALNYRPHKNELPAGVLLSISRYALYDDYHGFIKTRLLELAAFIQSRCPDRPLRFKACADSIPLAERALARRAGLGFIGRNHFLIHPELGGQLLLGELLTTLPLEPDTPMTGDFCADCGACIAACPAGALGGDGAFDARKCLSYLTIEEPDAIDDTVAEIIGDCLFGCDSCLMACPYEKNAPPRTNTALTFHPERLTLCAEDILEWTQADFDAAFKGSCLERLGLARLQRNARLCRRRS
jgi:epoxyqueuosine reductase